MYEEQGFRKANFGAFGQEIYEVNNCNSEIVSHAVNSTLHSWDLVRCGWEEKIPQEPQVTKAILYNFILSLSSEYHEKHRKLNTCGAWKEIDALVKWYWKFLQLSGWRAVDIFHSLPLDILYQDVAITWHKPGQRVQQEISRVEHSRPHSDD